MDLNVVELTNEFMYRAYVMNRDQGRRQLTGLSIREYIALQRIIVLQDADSIYSGKVYLKDLAENLRLTMRHTSKLAGELKDRGLVTWTFDGDGSEGTYLSITDHGRELVNKNEEVFNTYYGRVIEKYGKDNMIHLLRMMKELETIMQSEIEDMEGAESDYGNVE